MKNLVGCARQRDQVVATGFEKDEALLRNSEDRFGKMLLPDKSHHQSSLFQSGQPPAERPRPFGEEIEREQGAQLVKANRARIPYMQQDGDIPRL
jgi:hypothetical protein